MAGVCMCVLGPPADGSPCSACGQCRPVLPQYLPLPAHPGCVPQRQLTEEDVRRIIREELQRKAKAQCAAFKLMYGKETP